MSDTTAGGAASAEAEAYGYLLERIRRGVLGPGTRLRAEEIADEIGMSRMPVREALRRLDTEGFVTLRPNRGAVVAGLASAEIIELFEIRSVLEGLAARLAARRFGSVEHEEALDLVARMVRAENDADLWIARHQALHQALGAMAGRPRLLREIDRLQTLVEPYMRVWFTRIEQPVSSGSDHEALVAALASGDAERAERTMREHVLVTAPVVAAFLSPASAE